MIKTEKTRKLTRKDGKSWEQPMARNFNRPMATEIETGELLYGLVRAIKPTNAIETGTFEGFSAVNMAKALKQNKKGFERFFFRTFGFIKFFFLIC